MVVDGEQGHEGSLAEVRELGPGTLGKGVDGAREPRVFLGGELGCHVLGKSVLAREHEQLLILTGSGYGRRLSAGMAPVPPKANSRGRVLVARRPARGLARLGNDRQVWAVTDRRWVGIDPGRLPAAEEDSTRTWRLLKLAPDESILSAFTTSD